MRMPLFRLSRFAVRAWILLGACTCVASALNLAANAAPVTKIVAVTGMPAPDGNGTINSFFLTPSLFLSRSGQVAFTASLTSTQGASGLFRGDGVTLSQIARRDQPLPGGVGSFAADMQIGGLNDAGQVAFRSSFIGGPGPATSGNGIFLGDGQTVRTVARAGQVAPDGNGFFMNMGLPTGINEAGQVAFVSQLQTTTGGETDNSGVYLGNGTTLTQIAREGQPSPNGSEMYPYLYPSRVVQGVNDIGQVVFSAPIASLGGGDNLQASRLYLSDGMTSKLIAKQGEPAPDGATQYSLFSKSDAAGEPSSINAAGQVAFQGSTSIPGGVGYEGIFLNDGQGTRVVARTGQAAPDGNGQIFRFRDLSGLTDSGNIAFLADLASTTGGAADNSAIFRTDGDALLQVARIGQATPEGVGNFTSLWPNPAVSDGGHVAFQATLNSGGSGRNEGVYLFHESFGQIKVARTGDSFLGSSIISVFAPPIGRGGSTLMNVQVKLDKHGLPMVAFGFRLADRREGIALWSLVPEPGSLAIVAVGAIAIALITGWPPRSLRRGSR
jgi:hypothetical protein